MFTVCFFLCAAHCAYSINYKVTPPRRCHRSTKTLAAAAARRDLTVGGGGVTEMAAAAAHIQEIVYVKQCPDDASDN